MSNEKKRYILLLLGKRGSYSICARNYAARYNQQFAEISCDSFAQILKRLKVEKLIMVYCL